MAEYPDEARLEEFEFFFDLSRDLFCVADFKGYFKILNPAWEAKLGFTRQELMSVPFTDFVHPHDRERTAAETAKLATGDRTDEFENRYRCKDGSYRVLVWNAAPSLDRGRIYAVAHDVTELKRAETVLQHIHAEMEARIQERTNELQAAKETLQSLIDASPQPIIALDLERRVRVWNHAAEHIFGWSALEVIGQPLPYVPPEKQDEHRVLMKQAYGGKPVVNVEVQRSRRNGSTVDLLSSIVTTHDPAGHVSGYLIIATDITEQKQLQAQLYRAQRLESIGMLASGIAHDLNNVLAPILMGIQLFKDRVDDESSLSTLAAVESSAKRGANLVKQVLTFARGLAGERIRLQFRHVLADVEKILNQTLPKSIHIRTDLPKDLPSISADPTQLHQVLMNLCVNARDAMPEGGVLTISGQTVKVDEHYAAMHPEAMPGAYIAIDVADTGTGIPHEILDRIFDPFFTTKPVGAGTGLGLSTAHAIVKSHGGFVTVYSEIGKGTSFRIYLPALIGTEDEAQPTLAKLPSGHGELILVVDDEAAVRDITRITLESYGYQVLTASDGAEGLGVYAKNMDRVRVIICDMNMPVMDGAAMIQAVHAISPAVKILSSSGMTVNAEIANRASRSGTVAFIAKPYTAEQLLQKIDELIKRS